MVFYQICDRARDGEWRGQKQAQTMCLGTVDLLEGSIGALGGSGDKNGPK